MKKSNKERRQKKEELQKPFLRRQDFTHEDQFTLNKENARPSGTVWVNRHYNIQIGKKSNHQNLQQCMFRGGRSTQTQYSSKSVVNNTSLQVEAPQIFCSKWSKKVHALKST